MLSVSKALRPATSAPLAGRAAASPNAASVERWAKWAALGRRVPTNCCKPPENPPSKNGAWNGGLGLFPDLWHWEIEDVFLENRVFSFNKQNKVCRHDQQTQRLKQQIHTKRDVGTALNRLVEQMGMELEKNGQDIMERQKSRKLRASIQQTQEHEVSNPACTESVLQTTHYIYCISDLRSPSSNVVNYVHMHM